MEFLSEKFFEAFEKFFENLIFCFNFFENFSLISPVFTKIRPQQLSFQPIFSRSFVFFLHCSFLILVLTPFRIHFSNLSLTFHHTAQCSAPLSSTPLFIFPPIPLNPHYSLQSNSLQSNHTTRYNPVKLHPPFLDFPLIPPSTIPIPLRAGAHSSARARVTHYARVPPATIYKYICHLSKPNFCNKKNSNRSWSFLFL